MFCRTGSFSQNVGNILEIFWGILSILHNIVMDMNNVLFGLYTILGVFLCNRMRGTLLCNYIFLSPVSYMHDVDL